MVGCVLHAIDLPDASPPTKTRLPVSLWFLLLSSPPPKIMPSSFCPMRPPPSLGPPGVGLIVNLCGSCPPPNCCHSLAASLLCRCFDASNTWGGGQREGADRVVGKAGSVEMCGYWFDHCSQSMLPTPLYWPPFSSNPVCPFPSGPPGVAPIKAPAEHPRRPAIHTALLPPHPSPATLSAPPCPPPKELVQS